MWKKRVDVGLTEMPAGIGADFSLKLRCAYPASKPEPQSIVFCDESTIVMPIGRHLWKYNTHTRRMDFLCRRTRPQRASLVSGNDVSHILHVESVPPGEDEEEVSGKSKRKEPVPERDRKAQMTLVEVSNGRSPWKFSHPFPGPVSCTKMTNDNKLIVSVVTRDVAVSSTNKSGVESAVAVWKTEIRKVITSREFPQSISSVSFSPDDNSLLCATGQSYLRLLKLVGNSIEELPLIRRPLEIHNNFTMHAWINPETIVTVTSEDKVLIIHNGEHVQTVSREDGEDSVGEVSCIIAYNQGFILGTFVWIFVVVVVVKWCWF